MQLHTAVLLAGTLLQAQPASVPSDNRHWEVPASLCGLAFKIPEDWVVERDAKVASSGRCNGALKAKQYEKLVKKDDPAHFWMVQVEVTSETFESAMEGHEIRREGDRWFVGQGALGQTAYEIKGPGWWGLRVDGRSIRSGPRVGHGSFESEADWVIISSTTSKTVATFLAGSSDSAILPLLLSTARFESKR